MELVSIGLFGWDANACFFYFDGLALLNGAQLTVDRNNGALNVGDDVGGFLRSSTSLELSNGAGFSVTGTIFVGGARCRMSCLSRC